MRFVLRRGDGGDEHRLRKFLASTAQNQANLTDTSWGLFLGLWVLLGIGTSMINTPSSRLLRRVATDDTRSYLFTAQFSLSHACFLLAYPLAGWVGAAAGQSTAALTLGAFALIGTITALVLWPAAAKTTGTASANPDADTDSDSTPPAPATPPVAPPVRTERTTRGAERGQ